MLNYSAGAPASTGYNLTRSLRFRASASAYLNRTLGVPTDSKKFTYSTWMKRGKSGGSTIMGSYAGDEDNFAGLYFNAADQILYYDESGGVGVASAGTAMVFRDFSAWYHIVFVVDTTQATAANRMKLYVNGAQVTFNAGTQYGLNDTTRINFNARRMQISATFYNSTLGEYFDGYLAETYFIDGQGLTPSSFGAFSATTGVWQPAAYTGTYGTNGFYLPFTDNSSATPAGLGKDFSGATTATIVCSTTSGSTTMTVATLTGVQVGSIVTGTGIPANTYVVSTGVLSVTLSQAATSTNASLNYVFSGNNWTTNNISITAGVTYDSMTDVPTLTNATTANYAVLNPLAKLLNTTSFLDGNLKANGAGAQSVSTIAVNSGKWYAECIYSAGAGGVDDCIIGVQSLSAASSSSTINPIRITGSVGYNSVGGSSSKVVNNAFSSYGASWTNGDVIGVAFDYDANQITFYKNNVSQGAISYTFSSNKDWVFANGVGGGAINRTFNWNFGQRPFAYTPPTGFVALNTFNLPTASIVKGNTVMDATLYTGNGSSGKAVTNTAGFKPDFVWIKDRSAANFHILTDSVRGVGLALYSNGTFVESAYNAQTLQSFNSGGFTVGSNGDVNTNTNSYVGWQWQAGQGSSSSNTSGSITSTVSVNASAGFSVVTYTGTGSAATVGHGLGVAPKMIITKPRNSADNWISWHTALGSTGYIYLNLTNASATAATVWNSTLPSSSVFSIGTSSNINSSGQTQVAYCWSEIDGFSKFGSYTGNGSADGPFVYTGFRPKFVMIKVTNTTQPWIIIDTARNTFNVAGDYLMPNASNAENGLSAVSTATALDVLSNGFKLRNNASSSGYTNGSGNTYIYACFAENPFKNALAR